MTSMPTPDAKDLDVLRLVRRHLHRHPEVGHQEHRSAAAIERFLAGFGLTTFRPAPTSVATVVPSAGSAPAVGFRAELDALPVIDATGTDYASTSPGVSHACGHDGHSALLVALARRLAVRPPADAVLLVFQQAEETTPSGARQVISGITEHLGRQPDEFFGFHLWPDLPQGTLGVADGPVFASVAGLTITVIGHAGRVHGTGCDDGSADALDAGTRFHRRILHTWRGRHPRPGAPSTVTIGRLDAGDRPNRIATLCRLEGTVRALTAAEESAAHALLAQLGAEVAGETGTQVDVNLTTGIRPPVINTPAAADRVRAAAHSTDVTCRRHPDRPVGVSDDFGWYTAQRPGALVLIGCGRHGQTTDLHDPRFDFDEEALLPALATAERLARR
jgi:amidohydrolase